MTLQELKDERNALLRQRMDLTNEAQSRDLTDDEQAQRTSLAIDAGKLLSRIEAINEANDIQGMLDARPGPSFVPSQPGSHNPVVEIGAPKLADDPHGGYGEWGFGQFAHDIFDIQHMGQSDRLVQWAAGTGVNQTVGSEGGFLVPPAFSATIWDGMNEASDSLLSMTDSYTVDQAAESLTFNANAETNRADGSRWGGVRGYWITELSQITSSLPNWRQMKLEPKELAVLVYVSDKMLRNANTALSQYITRAATDEINFKVGDAIINGDGAGKPLGILASDCKVSVTKETGQAAATIVPENIVKMWARMHARSRANAVWLINQVVEPQLLTMTLDTGTSGMPVYMPPGGLSGAPYATLLGKPVIPIEYCQALGTAGDIILADMKGYATGTKGGVRSDLSIHLKFDYAQSAFRFMFEVDGQPWLASAITPFKGSDTQSPFVLLGARS